MTHKILRRGAFEPEIHLFNLAVSDTGLSGEQLLGYLGLRMQQVYPGNYHIVRYVNADGHSDFRIKYDTPEDETWFKLKYA
jgi:hypothetical protein